MILIASKIVFCLILAALIGAVIGFLIGRASREGEKSGYKETPIYKKQANIYNKPFILGNPRPSGKDNLQIIEGIDEEIEEKLNHLGIFHFEQISKWNERNVEWVSESFSLESRIVDERWVEQAKELMKIK